MLKLLFICTHNRCRSILCEAISNQLGEGKLLAHSAGSQPAGEVHPLSLQYLTEAGYNTAGLRSQSWDDFAEFAPDITITVCDSAAGESCPLWMGKQLKVHWGLKDPSSMAGSDEEVAAAFRACIAEIEQRTRALLALDLNSLPRGEWREKLAELGAV